VRLCVVERRDVLFRRVVFSRVPVAERFLDAVVLRRVVLRPVVLLRRVPVERLRPVVLLRRVPVERLRPVVLLRRVPVERLRPVVFRAVLFRPPRLPAARTVVERRDVLFRLEVVFRPVVVFRRPVDFRAVDFRVVDLRRAVRLRPLVDLALVVRALRRLAGRSARSPSSESSESPFPISFFATPTAAGTATPIAAPAAIFFGVESPSSSPSELFTSFSSATIASLFGDGIHERPSRDFPCGNCRAGRSANEKD
jgi:hypothetical protein